MKQHDTLSCESEIVIVTAEIGSRCGLRHDGEGVLLSLLGKNKLHLKFKSSWKREKKENTTNEINGLISDI